MKLSDVGGWVKEHPYGTGAIVFVVGLIILYFYFRKPAQAATGSGDLAAYYAAQAQVAASGNQLAAAGIAANAQTAQVLAAADVAKGQTAGGVQVATGQQGVDLATVAAGREVSLTGIGASKAVALAQNDTNASAVNAALSLGTLQTNAAQNVALNHDATTATIAKMVTDTQQYLGFVQALPPGDVSASAYPASQFAAYAAIPGAVPVAFNRNPAPPLPPEPPVWNPDTPWAITQIGTGIGGGTGPSAGTGAGGGINHQ